METEQVIDILEELARDTSMPRNVRSALGEIKDSLGCSEGELALRVDSALNKLEELANDPNISQFGRTEIWSLTSAIEELNK